MRDLPLALTVLLLHALCSDAAVGHQVDPQPADFGASLDSQSAIAPKPSNAFPGTALQSRDDIAPPRVGSLLSRMQPDRMAMRGAAESRLYASAAPGVVLIATKDSLGSGSLISSDALVLTNAHVVGTAKTVAVVFKPSVEGAEVTKANMRRGTVIRRDEVADLALIQVADPPPDLTTIRLGQLTDVSVGSDVNAIGHPTGEAWSYTKGIVSQIRRNYAWQTEDGLKHKASVIQTQTPINPGNSGGPLLTDDGALVGVNSFKAAGEGLNFAVSVDDVRALLSQKSDRLVGTSNSARSECKPKSYGVSRLKDGSGTFELLDLDCFGKPDAQWILPDDPSKPGRLEVDPEHTGHITGIYFSRHRNGKWEYSIWDTTGSGKPDLKCLHKDGGATPTSCERISG